MSKVAIEIVRVSGQVVTTFSAERHVTVASLKQRVFDAVGVPSAFQDLVVGFEKLEEDTSIGDHCRGESSSVLITLIVSCDRLMRFLNRPAEDLVLAIDQRVVLMKVLRSLCSFISRGNDGIVTSLHSLLFLADCEVKCAAIVALGHVAEQGDEVAISLLLSCLELAENSSIKCACLSALKELVVVGSEALVNQIGVYLRDDDSSVRDISLEAFLHVSEEPKAKIVALKVAREAVKNGHSDREARLLGIAALRRVSLRGNEDAIATVIEKLEHPDESPRVRCALLETLSQIACRGHLQATMAVIAYFKDNHVYVRQAAVAAISELAVKGEHKVITAVMAWLEHGNAEVQFTTLEALKHVAAKGDDIAMTLVKKYATHDCAETRFSAVKALCEIGSKCDERALEILTSRLKDKDADVRRVAVECLTHISELGNSRATKALVSRLKDRSTSVRLASVAALEKLVVKGSQKVLDAVSTHLTSSDPGVRRTALEALGKLSIRGDKHSITRVSASLQDPDARVRRTAREVLSDLQILSSP